MMPLELRGGVHSNTPFVGEVADPLSEATGPGAETQAGGKQCIDKGETYLINCCKWLNP